MKKVLLLGAVVALSLVFAFSSFAQEEEGEVSCTQCQKNCSLGSLPCTGDSQQGRVCGGIPIDWDCFTFPVCDCPDTELYFLAGEYVGVRMHILTPGVYWATGPETLQLRAYESISDSCDNDIPAEDVMTGQFTNVLYFPDETCDPRDAEDVEQFTDCTWDERDYPKLKSLAQDNDEELFQIPEDWEGFSFWSVQIPNIRIDVDEIIAAGLQGEKVQIKIEFVRPGTGGICQGACQVICECIVEVATICPEETGVEAGGGCVYFPYVIVQYNNWATGIAISNVGGTVTPANMKAEFKLTDKTGKIFKYTINPGGFTTTNWSAVLDGILDKFDGTPAAGPAWLRIDTNFLVDGYQFVTDGIFGGSTLARICDAGDSAFAK